jgi:hypothetical protein
MERHRRQPPPPPRYGAFRADAKEDGININGARAWVCGLLPGVNIAIAIFLYLKVSHRLAFQALVMPLLYWPICYGAPWGIYFLLVAIVRPSSGSGFIFLVVPIQIAMFFIAAWIASRILARVPWPAAAPV